MIRLHQIWNICIGFRRIRKIYYFGLGQIDLARPKIWALSDMYKSLNQCMQHDCRCWSSENMILELRRIEAFYIDTSPSLQVGMIFQKVILYPLHLVIGWNSIWKRVSRWGVMQRGGDGSISYITWSTMTLRLRRSIVLNQRHTRFGKIGRK